jgi:hypothetical protein
MTVRDKLAGCIALAVALLALAAPTAAWADFGLHSFSVETLNADGSIDLQAGSHPFAYRVNIAVNQDAEGFSEGRLRNLIVELPPGLVGNPQAAPKCKTATLDAEAVNSPCPIETQVGLARVAFNGPSGSVVSKPIYNLTAPTGVPARLGFSVGGFNAFEEAGLRPGDHGVDISTQIPGVEIQSVTETIWGVPADSRHDGERECPGIEGIFGCGIQNPLSPFLSLPTSCTGPLRTTVRADSDQEPGVFYSRTVRSVSSDGVEAGLEGCDAPAFRPVVTVEPETSASDSATGLDVGIHVPQSEAPEGLASANLKDAVVTLPPGLVINPSAADGLGACQLEGPEGINLPVSTDPAVAEPAAAGEPAKCPASSKVGTVEVKTPLLDHPIAGTAYLAKQGENPFGSLVALYVALEDPITGIVIKLPGKVEPDPGSGRLRATFQNNPQLPFEDLSFDFYGGPRATLTTPSTCGRYTTTAALTPWTTPEGATANPSSTFSISSGPGGSPCSTAEAQMPNSASFEAGTTVPLAGSYSPFVLKVNRENGSQRIGALAATLPEGLLGRIAGIAECSDAQIASALGRSKPGEGQLEQRSPSCPLASEIGTVTVGAGSGAPLYVKGQVYLAGPYKGAPLSLEIISPAIAGPFDLGTVAVRTALYVNESTAQIHAVSDPIPSILAGIPLDIRSIAVSLNRPEFALNPTSCDAMQVLGSTTSTLGQTAALQSRFQVGGCRGLEFKPSLKLSFTGQTKRTGFPGVKAVLTQPKGQNANVSGATVVLPKSMLIANAHINNPCTRVQFNSGRLPGEGCPGKSILGTAKVWTPLLEKPEEGKVYFRSNGGERELPDLAVAIRGQIPLQLLGFVDSVGRKGAEVRRVRSRFLGLPDAPVSRFELKLSGGKKGLLQNSKNLCKSSDKAKFALAGQNGKAYDTEAKVQVKCSKMTGKAGSRKKHA